MVLINAPASFPAFMWAVVRFLAASGRPVATEEARPLLCPPSLLGSTSDTTFDEAVATLSELRLVEAGSNVVKLGQPLSGLTPDDVDVFLMAIRKAALDTETNTDIATNDAQTGSRDLVRALAWFLTLDPLGPAVGWDEVSQRQREALPPAAGPALVNEARWNRFTYWAPAIGLAAADLVPHGQRTKLVPDCSTAVRQCLQARFADRRPHDIGEVIDAVREALPVLPGGQFSRDLGLPTTDVLDPSLSFALLRGHDAAWWRLEHGADSPRTVLLTDQDRAGGVRRVSEITVWGRADG
jgi:hypothetical protein